MINNNQAELLLSKCELWLDTELGKLRTSLRNDHSNTKPMLWELIVLHAAASSIVSRHNEKAAQNQSIASLIQHEPTNSAPDIFLQPNDCQPFYIEAAHITRQQNHQQEENVKDFPRRVKKELSKQGVGYANSLRIRLHRADPTKDVQIPPYGCWGRQFETNGWKAFVTEISSRNLPSFWLLEETNVIVEAEGIEEGSSISSSFPVQNIPETAKDNPIYGKIKDKAEQAKKTWEGKYGSKEPLVLIIGATESLHQIYGHDMVSSMQLRKAVYSALADIDQWDWTTILNLTDNRSWPWAMRRQRVSGSKFISAVVIVTVRDEYSGLGCGGQKKASKPLIIKNPHPYVALTTKQEWFLEQIDFNQIKYGSGMESWEPPPRGQEKQDVPLLNKYLRESGGRFDFSPSDFAFNVTIPCKLVARFLVGDITADEVWDNHNLSIEDDLVFNRSLEKIGSRLKVAANIRQSIVNVEFVQGDARSREESRIKLEFGTFIASGKNGKDNLIDSIEFNTAGAFSVTLSTNLVTCLLAGKITAEEAWKGEGRQEISNFLRDAVSKGQKIIDSIFVQDASVPECESQITFKFGAATDTSIREDKKQLRELKNLKKQKKSG